MSAILHLPFTFYYLPFMSQWSLSIDHSLKTVNCPSTSLRMVSPSNHKLIIEATGHSTLRDEPLGSGSKRGGA